MEIQNLNGSRVTHAPESSGDFKSQSSATVMKSTLLNLKDIPNQKLQKDQGWILQIIQCKEFELKEEDEKKKLKIKAKYTLSDGVSFVKAMIPDTAFNKLAKVPQNFNIIRVDNFQKVFVQEQILLMLKDPLTVVYDHIDVKLGNPQDIKNVMENPEGFELDKQIDIPVKVSAQPVKPVVKETPKPVVAAAPVEQKTKPKTFTQEISKPNSLPKIEDLASNNYMPIKALNTFARDWIIKARISNKGDIKTTRNGGHLLKIELVDQYGTQIEGTFFNDSAKMFAEILEENKVYLFSNGNVKMANKKFTSVRNDFSIVFEKNSQIHEAKDDGSITTQAFDFCKIQDILEIVQMKTIDCTGIVYQIGDKESINLKTGQQKVRKYVQLLDDTMHSISLTMWGDDLCDKNEHLKVGDVIAIKSARVSEFGGKSLNAASDHAQVFVDLENVDCQRIKKWYTNQKNMGVDINNNMTLLTKKPQSRNDQAAAEAMNNNGDKNKASNLNLITEINDSLQEENDVDQFHFFFLNGYVSRIKNDERIYYPACQGENCRRKVVEDTAGFKCEHCGKTFLTYQPTYMITAKISDFTESIFVNFAREHGTALMGMKAEEFKEFRENNSEQDVQNFFDSLLFKRFNIMVKGKYEYFNGENRMRYFAVKVFPHNVQAENRALLRRLEMYSELKS